MEFRVRPLGFVEFFTKQNHQAIKKMNQGSQSQFHELNIYI